MNAQAFELSEALAGTVEAVSPAICRVEGRNHVASGVRWSDGIVATALHTVEDDDEVEVAFGAGPAQPATVAGRDPVTDLAILRTQTAGTAAPAWSDGEDLKVGHLVLAVGRPGRTARAALGILGTVAGAWRTPGGGRLERHLQVDLALPRGFSGGLLVDVRGSALGLLTSGLVPGAALAVPTAALRRLAPALLARGRIERGYLGVASYPVRLPAPLAAAAGQEGGLLVVAVRPQSPAETAGLTLGDVLLSFDGVRVQTPRDLHELLDEERVGREAALRLIRAGEPRDARITVGGRGRP